MHLKQKLFLHRLPEGGNVLNRISEFKEIIFDLAAMEVKYEEEDTALMLLCSLPSSYTNFRDTILYSRDTLTLNEVYEALNSKEKMKLMVPHDGSSSSQAEGLSVRGRTKEKNSNNGNIGKSKNGYRGGRNPETRRIAGIARETGMTSQSVSSCRIKKRGKVTNKVKILLTLLVMIVSMMLLSLLLDVLRPMMSGYLILHVLFICAHIEIGLILLIPLLLLVPFWVLIIHHARLKA